MNVNVISNPLKIVKVTQKILKTRENINENEFSFSVTIDSNYIDLTSGIWNVALSQFIATDLRNAVAPAVSRVFDISTNLCSMSSRDPYKKSSPVETKYLPLTSIFVNNLKTGTFTYKQFNPLVFFQVEKSSSQKISLFLTELLPSLPRIEYQIEFELTLLFQRIL